MLPSRTFKYISGERSDVLKVLIAIIAYNEEESISSVIRDLKALPPKTNHLWQDLDIVVFDDCSTDSTSKISADLDVQVLKHPFQSGNGMFMVSTYLKYAKDCDYDVVIQFDGDGQHLAGYIPEIYKALVAGKGDVVIGSRFFDKDNLKRVSFSDLDRRFGGKLISYTLKALYSLHVSDPTSGMKAYNKRAIDLLADASVCCEDSLALIILICQLDLVICEIPVVMNKRLTGESEFTLYKKVTSSLSLLLSLAQAIVKKR